MSRVGAAGRPESNCVSRSSPGSNAPTDDAVTQPLGRLTPIGFEAIMATPATQAA